MLPPLVIDREVIEMSTVMTSVKRQGSVFSTKSEFYKACDEVKLTGKTSSQSGLALDYLGDGVIATSKKEYHALIVGSSGNGKTRRVIIPTILGISKTKESMVITDPKGELYRTCASFLKSRKYEVVNLNLRSPLYSTRWNPLSLIEKYYRTGNIVLTDRAEVMLSNLVSILETTVHSEKELYWEKSAGEIVENCAKLIMMYGPEGSLSFESIWNIAQGLYQCVTKEGTDGLRGILPHEQEITEKLIASYTAAPVTLGCIIHNLNTMLKPFLDQSSVKKLMSGSEIDIESVGTKPTAVFIVLPDTSSALYPIASMFIEQLYSELIYSADVKNVDNGGALLNPVNFILDEFGTLPAIPFFTNMIAAGRSRGMRFFLATQTYSQLVAAYSEQGAETILSNTKILVFMGSREYEFLKYLVALTGKYKSKYTGEECDLISIQRLQSLEMGELLVMYGHLKPYISHLPDFTEYGFAMKEQNLERTILRHVDYTPLTLDILKTLMNKTEPKKENVPKNISVKSSRSNLTIEEKEGIKKCIYDMMNVFKRTQDEDVIEDTFISTFTDNIEVDDKDTAIKSLNIILNNLIRLTKDYDKDRRSPFIITCKKCVNGIIGVLNESDDETGD